MADTESSLHVCEIHWRGDNGDYDHFSRLHEVAFPGGQRVQSGAASKVQATAQTNPEELLAAAVGSCMMMTILAVFSKSKITVTSYADKTEALLEFAERRFRVTRVTLRPRIGIRGEIETEKLLNLIQKAHANCFITLSVKAEVVVEPTFVSGV
jgi:organic hydroperoxide reductase OsmC/OhrA